MAIKRKTTVKKMVVIWLSLLAIIGVAFALLLITEKGDAKEPVSFTTYDSLYTLTVPYGYRDARGNLAEGAILELEDTQADKKLLIMPCPPDYFETTAEFADYIEDFYLDELYGSVGYEILSKNTTVILGSEAVVFELSLKYDPKVICRLYIADGNTQFLEIQVWTLAENAESLKIETEEIIKTLTEVPDQGTLY